MAVLQTLAFREKEGYRRESTMRKVEKNHFSTYQRYYQKCPAKLRHCRIIKSSAAASASSDDGAADGDGKEQVVAACQLHLRRRRPNKNNNNDDDKIDVLVEWIACHPHHMNKGMGSLLLAWAASYAKQELKANVLTLYVVKANASAVRLYQRRGFVIQNGRGGGGTTTARLCCHKVSDTLMTLVCLGMDRHWTVLTMEKDITPCC